MFPRNFISIYISPKYSVDLPTYLCSFFINPFYLPLQERKESPPDTNEPAMELSAKLNRRVADKSAAE